LRDWGQGGVPTSRKEKKKAFLVEKGEKGRGLLPEKFTCGGGITNKEISHLGRGGGPYQEGRKETRKKTKKKAKRGRRG